jgi:hypothetical protein
MRIKLTIEIDGKLWEMWDYTRATPQLIFDLCSQVAKSLLRAKDRHEGVKDATPSFGFE